MVEYALFLGATLMLDGLAIFRRSRPDEPGHPRTHRSSSPSVKDGVIQMLVLMMIYGTLIPNSPATRPSGAGGDVCRARSPERSC